MNIVTLDAETFWSQTHSLSKMNPFDYVMHPETELISMSMKVDDNKTECVFGEANIRAMLNGVNWSQAYAVAHNMAGFDAMLLAWRLGVKPRIWGDTLAMARARHLNDRLSLAWLVEHYGVGKKDNSALVNTRGKHLADFTPAERAEMATYNCDDADQCFALFKIFRQWFSSAELWHLDCKIRAIVEPKLMLDVPLLEKALAEERAAKRERLLMLRDYIGMPAWLEQATEDAIASHVAAVLQSAPAMSQLLESRGVATPMKPSPTNPDNMIPALAKSDAEFTALLEHDDDVVASAVAARLAVKSTQAETRMDTFIKAAKYTGGRWPVTTHFIGATTGRCTGWLYNPLNLPKLNPSKPRPADALRGSIVAPPGHVIVVADQSGIEMRFNHFLWNVAYSTALWKQDATADIYKPTAASFYGVPVEQITKQQRQVGKVQQLMCGFGCGGPKYQVTARTQGGLVLTLDEAQHQVDSWRAMTPEISDYKEGGWARCQKALEWIIHGIERPIDDRGIFWTCEEGIRLPSGRIIHYPRLRVERVLRKFRDGERETEQFVYAEGRNKTYVYGGKVDENIVQAGARDVVYDNALEIFKRTGYRPSLEVYDELVYVVPEDEAEQHLAVVQEVMRTPPAWFSDLITWSEGDIGARYSDAK